MVIEIFDFRVCQQSAGIFPGCFILGAYPNGLISLLEIIGSTDYLLVEFLIKTPFNPADIREDVFALLHVLDDNRFNNFSSGSILRSNLIRSKSDTGSPHHCQKFSTGHSFRLIR